MLPVHPPPVRALSGVDALQTSLAASVRLASPGTQNDVDSTSAIFGPTHATVVCGARTTVLPFANILLLKKEVEKEC